MVLICFTHLILVGKLKWFAIGFCCLLGRRCHVMPPFFGRLMIFPRDLVVPSCRSLETMHRDRVGYVRFIQMFKVWQNLIGSYTGVRVGSSGMLHSFARWLCFFVGAPFPTKHIRSGA